jgi:cobyrinic acid a,c-diamide synthase
MRLIGANCWIGMGHPCEKTKLAKAIVVAAPQSGSGKTLVTLGLLRALKNRGLKVVSAKVGPDYIDARFHEAASGAPCINLDYWAMGPEACKARLAEHCTGADLVVIEGVMGLFDGPDGAEGSTADLAEALGLSVVLVIDAAKQAQSIAAVVHGFTTFRPGLNIMGVILNRVVSERHTRMLSASIDSPILGVMRHNDSSNWPSRHLGLVQAQENQQLEAFIESAASGVSRETFLDKIVESASEFTNHSLALKNLLPPLAQTMAIASDVAFAFTYPHLLEDWRNQGAELRFFSPLANETPNGEAVFLPGGYPELFAGQLAANTNLLNALRQHKGLIYGECGGYMVLGDALVDRDGKSHAMAGLLPLTTSFAARKLHLGYRQLKPLNAPWAIPLRGHEFHFSTIQSQGGSDPLFHIKDAAGNDLGLIGQRIGNVMGSYAHVISQAPA